ncbi:MAG: hypothetical protein K5841_08495 [Fretibacterium sp.]|nr:hypothetical protein [Fretibacterium sp.]
MYDNEQPQPTGPLDSTTSRIVTELASRLVPELTQSLASIPSAHEETLNNLQASLQAVMESLTQMSDVLTKSAGGPDSQEIARGIETMREALAQNSERIRQGLDEEAAGRKEVLNAIVILTEAITALRSQRGTPARTGTPAANNAVLEKMERLFREAADAERAGRQALLQPITSMVDELVTIRGQLTDTSNSLRSLKTQGLGPTLSRSITDQIRTLWEEGPAGKRDEMAAALMELSGEVAALEKKTAETVEKLFAPDARISKLLDDIPNWEGILRAHGQAQTHELDTLSQELSALQKESGTSLVHTLRETLSQQFAARDQEWEARLKTEREEMSRRMNSVKKALWALAGIGLLTLGTAAAHFIR